MTIRKLVGVLENKGPYIDASTGHWFYWNGTRYVDSGYPYAIKPIISFKIEKEKERTPGRIYRGYGSGSAGEEKKRR